MDRRAATETECYTRQHLKNVCWSLLHAGYCIRVRNTMATYISCENPITFTCNENNTGDENITDQQSTLERIKTHQDKTMYIHAKNFKAFNQIFDKYISHTSARFQRCKSPAIRDKKLEKMFARCAEQWTMESQ